jgi:hypothetical protein
VYAHAWAAGEANPAEYTINVHVVSSNIDLNGTQVLDVVIDGKKYELRSELPIGRLLTLGDYRAKLITNHKTAYESFKSTSFCSQTKRGSMTSSARLNDSLFYGTASPLLLIAGMDRDRVCGHSP